MNTPPPPPKWGELLRYTTDDRDITQHQLCIMQGGNGDWYVSIAESPDHYPTNAIRLCTSGGASHACPGLGRAIADAYRALYNQAQPIQPNSDPSTPEPWAFPLWKHLHDEHGLTLLESEIHEILRHAAPFIPQSISSTTSTESEAAAEALSDTQSLDELLTETQANCAQLIEQNLRLIQERNQARQDIADLNTRLIERQQDMMARIVQLRNDLRAATRAAINLAHEAIPKDEEDPYQSQEYQRFVANVAETCQAPDSPCDSCLAGGICDGPSRSREYMDNDITDNDE